MGCGLSVPRSLIADLGGLGLTADLQFALDAGDAASYTTGQKWLDLSGNGQDFFLGADGDATTTDPAFNGVAGGLSRNEYFSHDGGDYFTYDTTNEAWMETLHKAGAVFSFVCWINIGSFGAEQGILSTRSAGSTIGAMVRVQASSAVNLLVTNGGTVVRSQSSAATLAAGAWRMAAVSIDESVGTNGLIIGVNSSYTLASSTYSSPASGNASNTMTIGNLLSSGSRLGMAAMWDRALSQAELVAVYQATRGRYE